RRRGGRFVRAPSISRRGAARDVHPRVGSLPVDLRGIRRLHELPVGRAPPRSGPRFDPLRAARAPPCPRRRTLARLALCPPFPPLRPAPPPPRFVHRLHVSPDRHSSHRQLRCFQPARIRSRPLAPRRRCAPARIPRAPPPPHFSRRRAPGAPHCARAHSSFRL